MNREEQSNQGTNIPTNQMPNKAYKLDMYLGILLFFFAVLLTGTASIFIIMYGGEFLIVAENEWILYVFIILIIGGSIYNIGIAVLSKKSGRLCGLLLDKISNKNARLAWVLFWAIWNIFVAIALILVFRLLYIGAAEAVPPFLIILLGIPFFGYDILFIIGSGKFIIEKFRLKRETSLMRGLTVSGIAFLFVFSSFGIIMAFWNPQWTNGVQR